MITRTIKSLNYSMGILFFIYSILFGSCNAQQAGDFYTGKCQDVNRVGALDLHTKLVTPSGNEIYVEKWGSGTYRLVFFHDIWMDRACFDSLRNYVSIQDIQTFTFYFVDLPGSQENAYVKPLQTMENLSSEIAYLLDSYTDFMGPNLYLIGYGSAMGALYYLMVRSPEAFHHFISLGGIPTRGVQVRNSQTKLFDFTSKKQFLADPKIKPLLKESRTQAELEKHLKLSWLNWSIPWTEEEPEAYSHFLRAAMNYKAFADIRWAMHTFNVGFGQSNGVEPTPIFNQTSLEQTRILLLNGNQVEAKQGAAAGDFFITPKALQNSIEDLSIAGASVQSVVGEQMDHAFPMSQPKLTWEIIKTWVQQGNAGVAQKAASWFLDSGGFKLLTK